MGLFFKPITYQKHRFKNLLIIPIDLLNDIHYHLINRDLRGACYEIQKLYPSP